MNKIAFLLILSFCSSTFALTDLERAIWDAKQRQGELLEKEKQEKIDATLSKIKGQIVTVQRDLVTTVLDLTENKVKILEISNSKYSDGSSLISDSNFYNLPGRYYYLQFKTIFETENKRICELYSAALFSFSDNLNGKAGDFEKYGFFLHDNSPVCILNGDIVDSRDIKDLFAAKGIEASYF